MRHTRELSGICPEFPCWLLQLGILLEESQRYDLVGRVAQLGGRTGRRSECRVEFLIEPDQARSHRLLFCSAEKQDANCPSTVHAPRTWKLRVQLWRWSVLPRDRKIAAEWPP